MLFGKIVKTLRKPFPIEESKSLYYGNLLLISVFVTFFLFIFQPFGISMIESGKFLVCLGFGIMTFVGSLVFDFISNVLFKLKRSPEKFTFGKWIIYIIGLILCISLANFLFARLYFFGDIRWEFLPNMIQSTFAIGIFPVVILGWIALSRKEKKYQHIADEINQQQPLSAKVLSSIDLLIFDIPTFQIRYVEALQNYVKIGWVNSDGHLKEQTERATLKGILDDIEGSTIVKCHRSFLVNREAIISTSGNAQGLMLSLAGCEKTIPVSRSFVPVFRES